MSTYALKDILEQAAKLLALAQCPECGGCGFTVHEIGGCDSDGENDTRERVQEQCRWCYEKNALLNAIKIVTGP